MVSAIPANADDLAPETLRALLPGRAVRSYPALLSTAADAMAWARSGAAAGSLVLADYQASPRGRGGLEWRVRPGASLCFSMVLRPTLPMEREGWLYTVAATALADAIGPGSEIEWPDRIVVGERVVAELGAHVELGPDGVDWAVLNVLVPEAPRPRGPAVASIVEAVEERIASAGQVVLDDYAARCRTVGRRVRARLIPMGPGGVKIEGTAVASKLDGALTIRTLRDTNVSVRPQNLGALESLAADESPGPERAYPDYRALFLPDLPDQAG